MGFLGFLLVVASDVFELIADFMFFFAGLFDLELSGFEYDVFAYGVHAFTHHF